MTIPRLAKPSTRVSILLLSLILFAASAPSVVEIELDADGNPIEFTHATMSDGVKIALAIGYRQS